MSEFTAKIKRSTLLSIGILVSFLLFCSCTSQENSFSELEKGFANPPDAARPGVYWYFMDGNLSGEAITKDLESMKKAGIGYVVYLEVNVGVPRGSVDFLSPKWKALFKHAVEECERLGIAITLGAGPGWTGSGGPWVEAQASMQHLATSSTEVRGSGKQTLRLPVPIPKRPFFGERGFTPQVRKQWEDFYEDVAVLAFPTPPEEALIPDSEEKALYYRAPYSSQPGVKQYLPTSADYDITPSQEAIEQDKIVDLSALLKEDGSLEWDIPEGNWTVMRFGSRNNGAVTRPAPLPGVGLEADKFDTVALNAHLDKFTGELLRTIGKRDSNLPGGLKMLHMDSWEMGAQNWTQRFREEFIRRRQYDPQPFYPVYAGMIVGSREISERFLWDLRLTSQELVLENHAGHLKEYGHRYGLGLSIEPYDMNPSADLELAVTADMPMCEFWSAGYGFNTSFSAMEGTSAAHLIGQPVVPAEAFTAHHDGWRQHPGSMKDQSDWAFAAGINRLVYHTFQHQALDDTLRPGMTMGPYGVHWDRNQTWWPMADAYHRYVSRCQFMLQQGRTAADILYLTPEGAPHVFRAPESALEYELPVLPDRKGYSFDGCPPVMICRASVKDGRIVFPGGASYRMLVLPDFETMTPGLLKKIKELVHEGATVIGLPPKKSPGLTRYPECDSEVESLSRELWGSLEIPEKLTVHPFGNGKIIWGSELKEKADNLYPHYGTTAAILAGMNVPEDFASTAPLRYTHRILPGCDIYFVANRTEKEVTDDCLFRITGKNPELWDPLTGETRPLPEYSATGEGVTKIPLAFGPYESYFIVFRKQTENLKGKNFESPRILATLDAPWKVSFDPAWGGPAGEITFDKLTDWTQHPDPGIKYYSGTAVYRQKFDLPGDPANGKICLNIGKVKNMARIHLNGKEAGTVWTSPWQLDITGLVKQAVNELEIEVVNLWPNRLIGDEQLPDDGIQSGQWPEWLLKGEPRSSGRYTFTTYKHYTKDSPLLESGLLGPVTIQIGNTK
ncbi:MAG: glycosyl hydrolase [Tannerella sp.]|jgi:hypothetical protein|nr:glycosyl hydrolase [Tannerella sp.]